MPAQHKGVFVVAFLCIGCLALAIAVKIYQTVPSPFVAHAEPVTPPAQNSPALSPLPTSFHLPDLATTTREIQSDPEKPLIKAAVAVSPPGIPGVTAHAYLVGNIETGEIYLERNGKLVLPVASMSKLVTAFVVTNTLSMDQSILITEKAASVPPDKSLLKEGEKFTLEEILQPLLLSSSNVAAEALAATANRADFLELMKGYSWEIGMPSTFFADPSGVDPENVASARDLFALAKYLFKSRPDILAITRTARAETATTTDHGSHVFASTHPFAGKPDFIGGKTGRTPEAGDTMLTILKIEGQPIALVVLGSKYDGRASDTRILAERVATILKNSTP